MKPRIEPLPDGQAPAGSLEILQRTGKAMGMVPNLYRALAHAPAALRAYVDTTVTLARGQLPAPLREQIAVATAGHNRCDYCAAAHTMLGKRAGLSAHELSLNLGAASDDPKTAVALSFVKALLEQRGAVPDEQLQAMADAGFSQADVVEIVAHVGMNWFTNTFNRLARTPVDFPALPESLEAA